MTTSSSDHDDAHMTSAVEGKPAEHNSDAQTNNADAAATDAAAATAAYDGDDGNHPAEDAEDDADTAAAAAPSRKTPAPKVKNGKGKLSAAAAAAAAAAIAAAAAATGVDPKAIFPIGTHVLARWNDSWWDARIVKVKVEKSKLVYVVHYNGFHARYDGRVEHADLAPFDRAVLDKQKAEREKVNNSSSSNSASKRHGGGQSSSSRADVDEDERERACSSKSKRRKLDQSDDTIETTQSSSSSSSSSTSSSSASSSSSADSSITPSEGAPPNGAHAVSKGGIKIAIPGALKKQSIVDWENVTRSQRIVSLPHRIPVSTLLQRFVESRSANTRPIFQEVTEGLRTYFDRALPLILLYRFERPQYLDLLDAALKRANVSAESAIALTTGNHSSAAAAAGGDKGEVKDVVASAAAAVAAVAQGPNGGVPLVRVSDVYGAEHFLRMFVKLPELLASTEMEQREKKTMVQYAIECLRWMDENRVELFCADYEVTSADYVRRVDSL